MEHWAEPRSSQEAEKGDEKSLDTADSKDNLRSVDESKVIVVVGAHVWLNFESVDPVFWVRSVDEPLGFFRVTEYFNSRLESEESVLVILERF